MTEAVERVFKKELDERETKGAQDTTDKVIANMLKGNESVEKIVLYTQASLDRIAAVAKKIGISTLAL